MRRRPRAYSEGVLVGYSYLLGLLCLAVGLVHKARRPRLLLLGAAVWALTMGVRSCTAARGESLTMVNSDGAGARWLGRLLDEGDVAATGAQLLATAHLIHDPDAPQVPGALCAAYRRMRAVEGDAPSPLVPTYLGLQSADSADVLVVDGIRQPRGALIFLHGFAGGFALPCWQIARAAREAELVTYCPSVGWRGDWWTHNGARTLEKAVALVHRRGLDRIYLAGLSNGAAGAARLAPRMRGTFRGVILISGASRDQPAPGVPVLVVQGRRDGMSGAELARAYAARTGAQYLDLDGGHFAFLLREEQAHAVIRDWLKSH